MTDPLDKVLADVLAGRGPDSVLLMRLLAEAATEASAREALARAGVSALPAGLARLERLQALWSTHPQAWKTVRSVLDGVAHEPQATTPDEAIRSWEVVFDRLAASAPEAGVALYSLGDPALLAAATQEIVTLMDGLGLLRPDRDALDLGCGIGRLVVALAPRMRSVLGIDISAGMIGEARRRCGDLANVRLLQGSGRDLGGVADASIDLVLAADVFPYLVQAGSGLPAQHMSEFSRILRPAGVALILNYSYRNAPALDRDDVYALASAAGLTVVQNGTKDLTLWDASTFLLRKETAFSR